MCVGGVLLALFVLSRGCEDFCICLLLGCIARRRRELDERNRLLLEKIEVEAERWCTERKESGWQPFIWGFGRANAKS